jgi:hypothetical protein
MSEFKYYGSWDDSWEIISLILQLKQFVIFGDIAYKTKKTQEIQSREEMDKYLLESTRSVFISSDLFTKYPVIFHGPNKNGDYSVNQLVSGPFLELTLSCQTQLDGKICFYAGSFFFQPYIIDPASNTQIKASDELRTSFSVIKKNISKSLIRKFWKPYKYSIEEKYQDKVMPVWIGRNALEMLSTGNYYLRVGNKNLLEFTDLKNHKEDYY